MSCVMLSLEFEINRGKQFLLCAVNGKREKLVVVLLESSSQR